MLSENLGLDKNPITMLDREKYSKVTYVVVDVLNYTNNFQEFLPRKSTPILCLHAFEQFFFSFLPRTFGSSSANPKDCTVLCVQEFLHFLDIESMGRDAACEDSMTDKFSTSVAPAVF